MTGFPPVRYSSRVGARALEWISSLCPEALLVRVPRTLCGTRILLLGTAGSLRSVNVGLLSSGRIATVQLSAGRGCRHMSRVAASYLPRSLLALFI